MKKTDHNKRAFAGILLAVVAYCLFPLTDCVVKAMGSHYAGTGIAVIRYCASTLVLGVLSFWQNPREFFSFPDPWMQLGRGAALAATTATFWVALSFLPLGEATVIFYLNPIIIVILSGLILKEKVPLAVWLATIVAFAGVVLVMRPDGSHIGGSAFLPLMSAFFMAGIVIMNRAGTGRVHVSVAHSQFLISLCGLGFALLFAVLGHVSSLPSLRLSMPTVPIVAYGILVALIAALGHFLLFMATQRLSAGRIAPFAYVQLLMAMVLGVLLFGDKLTLTTVIGAGVILAAGLITLRAQQGVVIHTKGQD